MGKTVKMLKINIGCSGGRNEYDTSMKPYHYFGSQIEVGKDAKKIKIM